MPVPDAEPYTLARVDGDTVAGLYCQPEQQRAAGVPPNWFSYVTVDSADATAERGQGAGRGGPRGSVRRHGGRPDGCAGRPDRGDARRLASRRVDRRRARQRSRLPDLERARHQRRRGRVAVLRRASSAGRSRRSTPAAARATGPSATTAPPPDETAACGSWARTRRGCRRTGFPYFAIESVDDDAGDGPRDSAATSRSVPARSRPASSRSCTTRRTPSSRFSRATSTTRATSEPSSVPS